MHEKESSTLLRGCTQLTHWHSHYKDVSAIESRITQLISIQQNQQESLVHMISILNVTRHATQVNRQHINILMDTMEKTYQDITTLYNITHSLYSSISTTHQIHLGQPPGFIMLHARNSPSHHGLYQCSHYRNILTTYSTCPRFEEDAEVHWGYTPFQDAPTNLLWKQTTFLQISMHPHLICRWTIPLINRCANTWSYTTNRNLWSFQLLNTSHKLLIMLWHIENRYLAIILDETSTTEISDNQFNMFKKANGQFCILNAPLLPLANPSTCLSSLYSKGKNSIQKRCSLQVNKANSISIPTSIAPNVWIITSSTAAAPAGIMLICPGEASRVLRTPIHVLRL